MAHSYLLAKKWREAVSLYNRVLSHATSAVTHFQEIESHTKVKFVFYFTIVLVTYFLQVHEVILFVVVHKVKFFCCCTLGNKQSPGTDVTSSRF